jgi:integrase
MRADTKTDTKPVKNRFVELSRFKLITEQIGAFLPCKHGDKGSIPTLASKPKGLFYRGKRWAEWPLSVKLSVNRRASEQIAATCQNFAETRRNSRSLTRKKPDWFLDSEKSVMKQRFILFRRNGVFYSEDTTTRKQHSLRTKDEAEALTLLNAKNESFRQPTLNRQIARTYLTAVDNEAAGRTWQVPMDEMTKTKTGATRIRHERAMKDSAFDLVRDVPILETQSGHFLKVLETGTVATNVFLRRIHNFALDMNWLHWPVLPKKQWPKVRFGEKRAVTYAEHQAIVAAEHNPERRAFYECCWHIGGAQSDIAALSAEDIDWRARVVSFHRRKTGTASIIRIGDELERVLRGLPPTGPLFPKLAPMREAHRSTEFARACRRLNIKGVTLHSYRYSWAERAKSAAYPERYAQEALGHNSKAVHRAYSKHAQVVIPALEEYEKKLAAANAVIVPMPAAAAA